MKKKTIVVECSACGGTGLYAGIAERKGCAVVCRCCDGTGAEKVTLVPFTKRKNKRGVKRVFSASHGFTHFPDDTVMDNGTRTIKYSRAGCTYQEWKSGAVPRPVTDLYCPFIHCDGTAPFAECREQLGFNKRATDCGLYEKKEKCWARYFKMKKRSPR